MTLSKRLRAILAKVDFERVADVGTDHAALAIELAKTRKNVIATDVSAACIARAKLNAENAGAKNIDFRVGDGLTVIENGEIDLAVIAGMGAREIVKILSASDVCRDFVLCAHQDVPILRRYLADFGYEVLSDSIVKSEEKYYSVIRARRGTSNYLEKEIVLGKDTKENPDFVEWCEKRAARLKEIYAKQTEKTVGEEIVMLEKALDNFTVGTLAAVVDSIAPASGTVMEGDNLGLLVGDSKSVVKKVLVTLDVTEKTVLEAAERGANAIVAHHPVMFMPIKRILSDDPEGRALLAAARHGISIISAHSNFDFANGGLNDYLMLKLNIVGARVLADAYRTRVGTLKKPMTATELAAYIGNVLGGEVRVVSDCDRLIRTVAVQCGGAGRELDTIDNAFFEGADCFISGDTAYHVARHVADGGRTMLVFGHYESEILFVEHMKTLLEEKKLGVEILAAEKNYNPFLK